MKKKTNKQNTNEFIKIRKTRKEEIAMILDDDASFSNTKKYISVYVKTAVDEKCAYLSKTKQKKLYEEIMADVPIAIERFLVNDRHKKADYKFSTYFSWYMAQHINKE